MPYMEVTASPTSPPPTTNDTHTHTHTHTHARARARHAAECRVFRRVHKIAKTVSFVMADHLQQLGSHWADVRDT